VTGWALAQGRGASQEWAPRARGASGEDPRTAMKFAQTPRASFGSLNLGRRSCVDRPRTNDSVGTRLSAPVVGGRTPKSHDVPTSDRPGP
jgi:hypothetical protein